MLKLSDRAALALLLAGLAASAVLGIWGYHLLAERHFRRDVITDVSDD
jgi:hypothetical protein